MLFRASLSGRVRRAAHAIILCTGVLASLPSSVIAASSVTLAWNQSPGTNIAGYKIYFGTGSHTYTNTVNVGNVTNVMITALATDTTYYFAATAYDTSGLESDYSTEVAYTNVTVTPPTIVLSSPANGASYTAPATINLAASVAANGHTITQVQFYNGATLLGADAAAPYSFAWAGVGAGSYSLTGRAVYDSGSTVASAAANVTVTNATPPTIALTAPANGASYTAPATINLAASVAANGHTITQVQFYNGATLLGADAVAPYSFAWASVGAGSYSLTARAVYDSGSTVASAAATVTVTNATPPTIALTAPANGASYTAPATINLAASVAANGHTITQVRFYNGATLLGADAAAPYSFTWANASVGTYSLTAQATYDSGSTVVSPMASVTVAASRPEDTPLAMSAIANQTMTTNRASLSIPFSVAGGGASSLTLSASSTNPALLPTNNIVFTGSNTNRTITLTPVSGRMGDVDITITVTSGGVAANASFHLSVTERVAWTIWWQNTCGVLSSWFMSGTNSTGGWYLNPNYLHPSWRLAGTGDFNGDGKADILWQNACGKLACWYMDGTNSIGGAYLNPSDLDPSWRLAGTGDFNGDGKADILWQNTCGKLACWYMDGTNSIGDAYLNPDSLDPSWRLAGTGDFNGDGKADILWQNTCGSAGLLVHGRH